MVGRTLCHYRCIDTLGVGGMGEVYLAEDTTLKRKVALKVLPPDLADSQERLERFQREAEALAALNHPSIVTVFSVESDDDVHFLTMELVEGKSLDRLIPAEGLPLEQFFNLALPLADALADAHERGIIHRDMKPANIMVDAKGRPKILDFGLAKLKHNEAEEYSSQLSTEMMTEEGRLLGTYPYMSPEQVEGKAVDHRSDLFSFGTVLYEMATGERPFQGDSPVSLMSSILRDQPPEVGRRRKELPHHLSRIVSRCLEKDPDDRYQRANDLGDDLDRLRQETPRGAQAPEKPGAARPGRTMWHRTGAVAVLVTVAALGVLLMTKPWKGSETAAPNSGPVIESLAVLPLDNLSGDPEQDYFAIGMTEALIADLSRLGAFRVISRTSVMQYKGTTKTVPEIAGELGVDAIVEGSVMRSGNRVRITTQLIDAASDHHLWAENFERELEDVLALQSEVAREIVRGIGANLGTETTPPKERRRVDPEAYDAYLKAQFQYLGGRSDPEVVIRAFERAIELDPTFAPAHARLADFLSYAAMTGGIPQGDAYLQSRQLARRAVELDPDLPYARTALARIHFQYEWDWSAAESEFERALELDPDNAPTLNMYGAYRVLVHGDCAGGLSSLTAARDRDPLNRSMHFDLGVYSFHCRQYDESIQHMKRVIALTPDYAFPRLVLAWNYAQKGWTDQATRQCDEVIDESGDRFDPGALSSCAWVNGLAGREEVATQLLSRLHDPPSGVIVDPIFFSWGCLAVEDHDCALGHLEEALRQRSSNMVFMRVAPGWDPLRDHPRFQAILEQMNFPS